jgi:predicted ribosome quality control (RQC) complex YloA/Tae2 family protein
LTCVALPVFLHLQFFLPSAACSIIMRDMREKKEQYPKVYEYKLPGGWKVLAGKTDEDNDILSLKLANPDDWWFHVRGMAGSHVLLRGKPDEEPDHETIRSAAAIAAFHSKARSGGVVVVSCTRAQYVTKPRGAKPGTVSIRKEKLLKVRPGIPEE